MRDLYIIKMDCNEFSFSLYWHLSPLSFLCSLSLSHWLPLSIQLISNRLYWHDWGILMVPKLYKKRGENMLHYICLSMSSPLRIPTLSLPVCTHCSQQKTQTISFLPARLPQPLLCLGIFRLLSTCKSPETKIFFVFLIRDEKTAVWVAWRL